MKLNQYDIKNKTFFWNLQEISLSLAISKVFEKGTKTKAHCNGYKAEVHDSQGETGHHEGF